MLAVRAQRTHALCSEGESLETIARKESVGKSIKNANPILGGSDYSGAKSDILINAVVAKRVPVDLMIVATKGVRYDES